MKPLWTQAAAGALVGAVAAALALLPGRLVSPSEHAGTLALPPTAAFPPVRLASTVPRTHRRVVVHRVVAPARTPAEHAVSQLASVRLPVRRVPAPAPTPAPKPRPRPRPQPLHVSPRLARHPRQPRQAAAPPPSTPTPAPAPARTTASASVTQPLDPTPAAAPAAAPTAAPAPLADTAAPPAAPTVTTAAPPADGHGHGHGDDHGDGHGHGHGRDK